MAATPGGKGKAKISFSGFDFVFQTKRKDGSETWRCLYKDCEARILKKTIGDKDSLEVLKDHSIEVELSNSAAVHLTLNCIKQRAIKNPEEDSKDTIKHGLEDAKSLIIASMPGPSVIEELIKNWRAEPAGGVNGRTPRKRSTANKENTPEGGRKAKAPRKRAKLAEDNNSSEAKESPTARTARSKRSRSKMVFDDDDTDEEELDLDIEDDEDDEDD